MLCDPQRPAHLARQVEVRLRVFGVQVRAGRGLESRQCGPLRWGQGWAYPGLSRIMHHPTLTYQGLSLPYMLHAHVGTADARPALGGVLPREQRQRDPPQDRRRARRAWPAHRNQAALPTRTHQRTRSGRVRAAGVRAAACRVQTDGAACPPRGGGHACRRRDHPYTRGGVRGLESQRKRGSNTN